MSLFKYVRVTAGMNLQMTQSWQDGVSISSSAGVDCSTQATTTITAPTTTGTTTTTTRERRTHHQLKRLNHI